MRSACEYIQITQEPLVKLIYDVKTGYNLAAIKNIKKGTPVVMYYGQIVSDDRNCDLFLEDEKNYLANIAPYMRGNGEHCVDASNLIKQPSRNLNLMGVYVNDYMMLKSLDPKDIKEYNNSVSKCNLEVCPDTRDYPVYIASRKIKKGEPLSVHYGLAYWLLQLGIHPANIKDYV